jgi:hypothetical protein
MYRNFIFKEIFLLSSFLQIAGLTAVSVGIWLFSIPAGIIFTGFALILVGLAIEKGK